MVGNWLKRLRRIFVNHNFDGPPNLLIVMPDELRQHAVGLTKTDPVRTPNIDKFATESLTLTQALSNCPICSPARAMLFTGKYPLSNGVIDNCYSETRAFGVELSEDEVCFSDVLKSAGYNLGYIGKYHLDQPKAEDAEYTEGWRGDPNNGGTLWDAYTPPGVRRHGFDFWYSYGCCDDHLNPHYWVGNAAVNERTDINEWSVKHETDVAIRYLENKKGERDSEKPFALIISHNPPHMPFGALPDEYKGAYDDKNPKDLLIRENIHSEDNYITRSALKNVGDYFSSITAIDEQFGRLLNALEKEGLGDETIVIFMSDHGEMFGSHGKMGKNIWYDESLLIPFIIRWKGRIAPRIDNILFNMPDIMPTLLSLMRLGSLIPGGVEGDDRSDYFLGKTSKKPTSGFYIGAQPFFKEERRGIKTDRYTFVVVVNRETKNKELILFDNIKDPYQKNNISGKNEAIVQECLVELKKWLNKTNDDWGERHGIFLGGI